MEENVTYMAPRHEMPDIAGATDLLPLFPEESLKGRSYPVIAGPCSAESRQQVLTTARQLSEAGIGIYRAGIWKPRTRPGVFEGVGTVGLPWLNEVKQQTGMLTATEIATRYHAENAINAGVDIIWIGARTTANPFAVQEIADVLAEKDFRGAVLVKNPVNPDLDLWTGALQRLYNSGIRRLGAIHRGFSAYGRHLYRNPPQWHIPLELRRRIPSLPVICDPSHIGGRRDLIAPLSQQALDMGFDGLIIESHCDPDSAWSDSGQQITPATLHEIIAGLVCRRQSGETEKLELLRSEIDRYDNELIEILSKRMNICREIGRYKKLHSIPAVQTQRYGDMMEARAETAVRLGMSDEFMRRVFSAVHEESVRQQLDILSGDH